MGGGGGDEGLVDGSGEEGLSGLESEGLDHVEELGIVGGARGRRKVRWGKEGGTPGEGTHGEGDGYGMV